MNPSYRNWLQGLANNGGGLPAQEANALLQVVGDDFGINQGFLADPYKYTNSEYGQVGAGYGPQGISRLNDDYSGKYKAKYGGGQTLGATTSRTGTGTAASYDPGDLAYLNDQEERLRRQQGSADTALNNGLTQLQDSYNKEVSGANSKQSRALEDFGVKREDTLRAKDSAIGRVDTNARTLADSLRRRIGMASGANSSAYQFAAPGAVARDASQDRTGVMENFGMNFRNLDTTEKRVKEDFASLLQDLEAQRRSRESDFRGGILERKNAIDTSLSEVARQRALLQGGGYNQARSAMAPYSSAIDQRQGEIDNLFNQFRTPFAVKDVNVQAPQLRDYLVDRAAVSQNQTQGQDPTSPYGQLLRRDEDEERLV